MLQRQLFTAQNADRTLEAGLSNAIRNGTADSIVGWSGALTDLSQSLPLVTLRLKVVELSDEVECNFLGMR